MTLAASAMVSLLQDLQCSIGTFGWPNSTVILVWKDFSQP